MKTVQFLGTENSCRSIMVDALINHLGAGNYTAFSPGSKRTGQVHPLALETLQRRDLPVSEPRSKSCNEFASTPIDIVITVCDNAAGAACPILLGEQKKPNWSSPDPAAATGTEREIFDAFPEAFLLLRCRIEELVRDA